MKPGFVSYLNGKKGASLVEYGLLAGLISVLAITSVLQLGEETEGTFEAVASSLSQNLASATSGTIAAQWNDYDQNAVTAVEFSPAAMPSASDWYGFYEASAEGTAIKKTGSPEMVGTHFNPNSGGALHVNFASLTASFVSDNRITCRTEANADIFSANLSAASQSTHSGYPYLRFTSVSIPELDINQVDLSNPVPVLCEILPI